MKKSLFIHGPLSSLKSEEETFFINAKNVLDNISDIEIISRIPEHISHDKKERPLLLSKEIVQKIESDHGKICPENLIFTAHRWEYIVTDIDKKPDRINLIKRIPDSDNYLLIAANRDNGFYIVTHFETESKNGNNLKRLLLRGNVISRVSSVACTTIQDSEESN